MTVKKILDIFTVIFLLSVGQHADGQNIIFTDGEYINQIAACKDVSAMSLLITIKIKCTIIPKLYLEFLKKSTH